MKLSPAIGREEIRLIREVQWRAALENYLVRAGKSGVDPKREPKGATWKVEIAQKMRATTTASNRWLAEQLYMGTPNSVSHHLSVSKRTNGPVQLFAT